MKRKLAITLLYTIALFALAAVPVIAGLPSPDNDPDFFQSVNAYENVLETGDQLYLIYYNIDYTITGTPSTPANEAWIIRHINSDNSTNAGVVPYAYVTSGYGYGLASIYFSASDAPAWGGNYSMQITGNPALIWASGDPPSTTMPRTSFSEYSGGTTAETKAAISTRLQVIAAELGESWGPTYDLIQVVGGSNKFTSQGEFYFSNVILNLTNITPDLFLSLSESPVFGERTFSYTYSDNLSNQLIGTDWDFTSLATTFGTSRMWVSGLFWTLAVVYIIYRTIRKAKGYQHAFLLFYLMLPFGARLGYIPLVVPVGAMIFFGGLPVSWYFAHRQTS